jgi:pilus assembly protein CpaC
MNTIISNRLTRIALAIKTMRWSAVLPLASLGIALLWAGPMTAGPDAGAEKEVQAAHADRAWSGWQDAATPTAAPEIVQDQQNSFYLSVGEARIIRLPAIVRKKVIGNGKVISTSLVKQHEMLIVANDAGHSTLRLWFEDGSEVTYTVVVGLNNPETTFIQIKEMLGKADNVRLSLVGGRIFLQAETLKPGQNKLIEALQKAFPDQIVLVTGGDVALEERTVYVDAQLVEIKRSALENLGISWDESTSGPTLAIAGDIAESRYMRGSDFRSIGGTGTIPPFRTALTLASVITSRINLLKDTGDATIIANPRLAARCGGKATFTAGGEMGITVLNSVGAGSVEFKPYGIRLDIEPTCDKLGNIRAKMLAEVSEPDPSNAPSGSIALSTRKTESEIDLVEGKAMLLSGMTNRKVNRGENRVPYLGAIPLLGWLFKTQNNTGEDTELVVIVTPRFVTSESDPLQEQVRWGDDTASKIDDQLRGQGVKPQPRRNVARAEPAVTAATEPNGKPATEIEQTRTIDFGIESADLSFYIKPEAVKKKKAVATVEAPPPQATAPSAATATTTRIPIADEPKNKNASIVEVAHRAGEGEGKQP